MNSKIFKLPLLTLFCSAAVLSSCTDSSSESSTESPDQLPLLVAGRIYGYDGSDSGMLTGSQHIGVYMAEYPSTGETVWSNLGYTATYGSHDDYFSPDDIDNIPQLSRDDSRTWKVWAYYPYSAGTEDRITVSVANQASVSETTLLYAQATGISYSNHTAYLRLSPVLARITLTIKVGVGTDSVEGATVNLTGLPTTGHFDMSTAHFYISESSISSITMRPADGILSAMVIPQADIRDYKAEITVSGETRSFNFRDYVASFDRGAQYDFTVTVNRSSLQVSVSAGSIAGWGESGTIVAENSDN